LLIDMKKKILILGGGYSKERQISLKSAKAIIKSIKKIYKVKFCDPCYNLFKTIENFKPDVIFNALHGRFGEDGYIQSTLEILGIKYTHSGVISSMLSMDKEISKKIFQKNKILTPKFLKIKIDAKEINFKKIRDYLGYPLVFKPINEGSSLDVYICNNKLSLITKMKRMKHYREILLEKFIPGREIQVAIMNKNSLGAIELKPKRKFYDYKAKYNSRAKTEHIIPVKLSKKNYKKINDIALKAHRLLNCRGVTRSDFKFYKNKFYLLELNTQPGMTDLSLVPEIAAYKGIKFRSLINWMINDASTNR
tara:strand:- start:2017 stop:2940 length:924 start_codon:yes stop_codon:yes gene_type:complete